MGLYLLLILTLNKVCYEGITGPRGINIPWGLFKENFMAYPKCLKDRIKFYNWWLKKHKDLKCYYCAEDTLPHLEDFQAKKTTIDHKHPRSLGGSNKKNNLVIACRECNMKKGNIPLELFLNKEPNEISPII